MIYWVVKWMKALLLTVSSFASTFCLIVFLFCLHFCILNHFKTRYTVKSLIAISTYILLKYNWKIKLEKFFLGARVWALKLGYWSPKWPEYVTGQVQKFMNTWHCNFSCILEKILFLFGHSCYWKSEILKIKRWHALP